MLLKKISGLSFAVAFVMAIVLFTNIGRDYIPVYIAKYIFITSGAIGLVTNLIGFQNNNSSPLYNFLFWAGSLILFFGLIFLLMRWPYGFYIIVFGLFVVGASFILPESLLKKKDDSELLDDL